MAKSLYLAANVYRVRVSAFPMNILVSLSADPVGWTSDSLVPPNLRVQALISHIGYRI
jgi:hypothetical protein